MPEINLLNTHPATKRDYDKRAAEKTSEIIKLAKQFGKDFFDGDRKNGYGGYYYNEKFWANVIPDFIKYLFVNYWMSYGHLQRNNHCCTAYSSFGYTLWHRSNSFGNNFYC